MTITIYGKPGELAAFQRMIQDAPDSFICSLNADEEDTEEQPAQPFAAARYIREAYTSTLIAELKRRNGVRVIKAEIGHPYQIVAGSEEKGDVGPATILVIDHKSEVSE